MSSKKEVWKAITFHGKKPSIPYAVSSNGRFGVMHADGKVEVRTFKPQDGGYRYNYKINGKSKALFVYKAVADAFLKKPSAKQVFIIRKDHNYLNDRASNLKWATADEHKAHVTNSPKSIESRKKRAITKSYTAKVFDEKSIVEVKKLIWDPKRKLTFKQIAKKFKVSEMQIYRIKTGELWYHIRVANEPLRKSYEKNLQNIAFQEKKSEREIAANKKLHAARAASQKKNAERRARLKAQRAKNRKARKASADKKRKQQAQISKNYKERLAKWKKKREEKARKKAERLKKKSHKKHNKNHNKKHSKKRHGKNKKHKNKKRR